MKNNLLEHINIPQDLRNLSVDELPQLAKELREFIIDIVATKEGHLGASLGVVELTIALHYVFDTPNDLLVWDVGHQAYGHKILTGRKTIFHTNRQLGGISGFPKRSESEYDAFGVGHSSTSISAVLGMAIASKLKGESNKQHIAVIGDASIASGMAFEGLNHAGVTDANILIILNDNAMGIDPSVGALKEYFTNVKAGKSVRKNNIAEALNFNYSGPINGHDIHILLEELNRLKSIKGPKFLHITTTKGKGLRKAEKDQITYHAPGKFDKITGERILKSDDNSPPKYQDVFGLTLVELAEKNDKIVGITPAMPTGSSLKYMLEKFPERAFDVGIAEQHAVTLSAGLVTQGMIPYCNIYSTFLQRAYDQIIHDVAIQNLPVIFCLDRAGLVGEDGATHHGVFDIAYLRLIPNLVVYAPMNEAELRNILYTVQLGLEHPIAIRYPRGRGTTVDWKTSFKKIEIGKGKQLSQGEKIAVLTIGTVGNVIPKVKREFPTNTIAHFNMQFVKPLDEKLLHKIFKKFNLLITIEDGTIIGGFGSAILEFACTNNYQNKTIKRIGVPDNFIEHGKVDELYKIVGLDKESIVKEIEKLV
ncbi:1-deoxy-D-xylulose-5-phosphate synthase [Urechidicola croceus]|uniref:1-deoxy-D-xylulose-5-phosphate synthase n=1 Tax=Urechidicola croceus TaxID=1850246 RepID=A0A1D8P8V9_9FLAO|nr:1-deoxy-D-xylulose-5-phosphate synthase [Urechidicola croceus]AOW21008.1 1-deoxy-D-xylulose-5-phosphate synthase [Urechidicola croceus]